MRHVGGVGAPTCDASRIGEILWAQGVQLTGPRPGGQALRPSQHFASTNLAMALLTACAAAQSDVAKLPEVRELTTGRPGDVVSFIERAVECTHWSGEDPYDAERAAFIKKAEARARCQDLDRDEQELRVRYRNDRGVLDAIDRAKTLSM